jgi:hypothetical protein
MNQQQIILNIHLNHFQVTASRLGISVMPSHLFALESTTWIGIHTGTTWMPVTLLHAVRSPLAREIMSLHHTGITATARSASYVNRTHTLKHSHRNLATYLQFARAAKLADKSLRLTSGLHAGTRTSLGTSTTANRSHMPTLRSTAQAPGLIRKPKLHSLIPIALNSPNLQDRTGPYFKYSHRNGRTVFLENLRCSDLSAEYSLSHLQFSC